MNVDEIVTRDPNRDHDQGQALDDNQYVVRTNPRLVYGDPDEYFERSFFEDLLMEQWEQM